MVLSDKYRRTQEEFQYQEIEMTFRAFTPIQKNYILIKGIGPKCHLYLYSLVLELFLFSNIDDRLWYIIDDIIHDDITIYPHHNANSATKVVNGTAAEDPFTHNAKFKMKKMPKISLNNQKRQIPWAFFILSFILLCFTSWLRTLGYREATKNLWI